MKLKKKGAQPCTVTNSSVGQDLDPARPPFKEIAVILQQGTSLMLAGCSSVFLADFHPTS